MTAQHPYAVGFARPGGMSAAQKRRRDVLFVLVGSFGVVTLLALVLQSVALVVLDLLVLAALGAYCAALVQIKQQREQRANRVEAAVKVRQLPRRHVGAAPSLRRTVSSH